MDEYMEYVVTPKEIEKLCATLLVGFYCSICSGDCYVHWVTGFHHPVNLDLRHTSLPGLHAAACITHLTVARKSQPDSG